MKLRKNIVAMATGIALGSLFMFSNEAEAKTSLRYDIPDNMVTDTYVEGVGYFIGFNCYGQGIFSDGPSSSYAIIVGEEIDDPYSEVEQACQHYLYEIREDIKAAAEYGYKPSIKYCQDNIRESYPAYSEDIVADLFDNTGTERSKAMQIYIALAQQGYSINDIYVLMGPCNFSEDVMSQLFYSIYNQVQ